MADVIRKIDLIVIHCSATPNGRPVTVEDIDGWHKARGFRRDPKLIGHQQPKLLHIGYHYVIYTGGAVVSGRAEREPGAHVAGRNARSLGVCMVGLDKFSLEQWKTLAGCIAALRKHHPDARVCGHRDLSPDKNGNGTVEKHEWLKTCPGFDVSAWLKAGMEPLAAQILEAA